MRSRQSGRATASGQQGITMYPVGFLTWCTLCHSSGVLRTSLFHIMILMSAKRHADSSQLSHVTKIYLTCVIWSCQSWTLLFPRTYCKLKSFTWQFGRLFAPSSLTEQPSKLHSWQLKWLKIPSRHVIRLQILLIIICLARISTQKLWSDSNVFVMLCITMTQSSIGWLWKDQQ